MALDGSILVLDSDPAGRQALTDTLTMAGLRSVAVGSNAEAIDWLTRSVPAVVLLSLSRPTLDPTVLAHVRETDRLADVPVVVLADLDSDDDILRVFSSGADDCVRQPFHPAELVARVRSQIRTREYFERLSRRERESKTVLELTQALALTLNVTEILFTVVRQVAEFAQVDRCSIVLVPDREDVGYVLVTSDDAQLRDLPIVLENYPEIREVLATGRALTVRDATRHPLLEVVRQNEPTLEFSSLALVPILHERRPMGVLFLRSRSAASFGDYEMALVQTVANATAIALRNAKIMQSLRAESLQSASARVEAERRVQRFQRYADVFESAADGMIVIDRNGKVLFANPRASEITGLGSEDLVDVPFFTVFAEAERSRLERLLVGFREGVYPRDLDLLARRANDHNQILNVSFSSVLHEQGAVLSSFRDVTQERETAIELRTTKEFLERVIESSVDGIVSADLKGNILIFNRAACRIFGYTSAADVVGRVSVEQLYPPGIAREVMKKIRDPSVSGHGRVEDYRVKMVNARGATFPVSLSASLIMEADRPVGSVGIITDMRESLRMEERLLRAQEELRAREKQAIVAELAGGAAHELNQPLTSVLNYAELLTRNLEQDTPLSRAAHIIVTESERMAEIVRKIGKIARYETKSYVGEQRILDLEAASRKSDPPRDD